MIISKNNKAKATLTASMGSGSTGGTNELRSQDFSLFAKTAASGTSAIVEANVSSCDYGAIAGLACKAGTTISFDYYLSVWATDKTYTVSRDEEALSIAHEYSSLAANSASDYRIVITKASSDVVIIRYAAFGELCAFDVRPSGAFTRLFGSPQFEQRVQNSYGMPTANYTKRTALKSSINFNNLKTSDFLEFQEFGSHAINSGFFLFDSAGGLVGNQYGSAYCFNAKLNQLKSHDSTQSLTSFMVSFEAFTGALQVVS